MCKYLIALFLLVINHYADAHYSETQYYAFVESEIDNAYFITTTKRNPRFTGSNMWFSFANSTSNIKQQSLGYMGNDDTYKVNEYVDMWLEDSPITQPFLGIRCRIINTKSCPPTGLINNSSTILNNGVYHVKAPDYGWDSDSIRFRAGFNESVYQYVKGLPLNSSPTLKFRYCHINPNNDYDPSKGETCASKKGTSASFDLTIIKSAHLKLFRTNYLEEIFVDTNGNPNVVNNSNLCYKTKISNMEGLACKLISYSLAGDFKAFSDVKVMMATNNAIKPADHVHLQYSSSLNPNKWYNYDTTTLASTIFNSSHTDISVFFSNIYLKKIITDQSNSSSINKQFSFIISSPGNLGESGFYEFTPSSQFIIKSKEHSISIANDHHSSDNSLTGTLGSTSPITFNYIVSVSSGELAEKITASVSGPTIDVNGKTYCKFTSEDEKIVVPFPAYLSLKNFSNIEANCDNKVIDITKASWEETQWNKDIMVLQTNLALNFPMNNPISLKTVDSKDWEGSVSAAGTITVNAEWPNVE